MSDSIDVDEIIAELVLDGLTYRATAVQVEAYAAQVARLRDARARIAKEGLLVADSKGNPMPHPALVIERAAAGEVRAWASVFRPKAGPLS